MSSCGSFPNPESIVCVVGPIDTQCWLCEVDWEREVLRKDCSLGWMRKKEHNDMSCVSAGSFVVVIVMVVAFVRGRRLLSLRFSRQNGGQKEKISLTKVRVAKEQHPGFQRGPPP